MALDATQNEIQSFYEFLGQRISQDSKITPEQSVQEFRAYQQELRLAQAELRQSHQQFLTGQGKPLDVDGLLERVRTRLARQESTK